MQKDHITIRGARQHNLKNINLTIPKNRLIVITGLSGSGKSSLAFDTLYAEGQRRYVESLSTYARQFLNQMEKPDVDFIEGLSPAIAIEQKAASHNPRSTVGTVTEIYDYLRLLYARIGTPHCYRCGKMISSQTTDQMVDRITSLPEKSRIIIKAPLVSQQKGSFKRLFLGLKKAGFSRVKVDGRIFLLEEEIRLEKNIKHDIDVVVDRLVIKPGIKKRLTDSIELALSESGGVVKVEVDNKNELLFSENATCLECDVSYPEFSPASFSFNSPLGACPRCDGLGAITEFDPDLIVPNHELSLREGAVAPWANRNSVYFADFLDSLARHYGIDIYTPYKELPEHFKKVLLYGSGDKHITFSMDHSKGRFTYEKAFEGIIPQLERRYKETDSAAMREEIKQYMKFMPCPACGGNRLKPESLAVKVEKLSISELTAKSVTEMLDFFTGLKLDEKRLGIAGRIIKETKERLSFLDNVGLGYLTIDRSASTLSGGESQRIRLATQIGSKLTGVLYVLDEPSIGLHPRDNERLLRSLTTMRDIGNTVVMVEHDEETIKRADHVVDMGPGAGVNGGEVIFSGPPEELIKDSRSLTGQYLSGRKRIEIPSARRKGNGKSIVLYGACENNLKKIDVRFPLGTFTCVTGVSGSGKSSLVLQTLYRSLCQKIYGSRLTAGKHAGIKGLEHIDKVINIDQSPIGRTPRSNPGTYTSVFNFIRELFSRTEESRMRGYKPGRFSFNVKGGRCEACRGDGIIRIEMHFLPDVYVACDICKGKRYNRETLDVKYKGKNIAQVLDMTVNQAHSFFKNIKKIQDKLQTLIDVGIGYVQLGQPATTLSGGEAQRIKLSRELSKRSTGKTLYILDEPTTGLHSDDIRKLLNVLNRLVDSGNTVIVIEHNLDVIKCADHIIDLGPEGGDSGGYVIASGTPEQVADTPISHTGLFLKRILS